MAIQYVIDAQQRIVQIICHGRVTADEIFEHHQKIKADPLFDPDFAALIDASDLGGFDVSWDLLNRLKSADPFSGKSRRAVVAPGSFAFGLGRMYQGLRRDSNFAVFRNQEDARKWVHFGIR